MYGDIAYLITDTETVNSTYDNVRTEVKRKVFVEKKSISRNEFYQAHATGLKPEIILEMWLIEYDNEDRVEFEGTLYDVLKTYEVAKNKIELTLVGLVNGQSRAAELNTFVPLGSDSLITSDGNIFKVVG